MSALSQKHYLRNESYAGIKWFGRHNDPGASNSTEQGSEFDLLNKLFEALRCPRACC